MFAAAAVVVAVEVAVIPYKRFNLQATIFPIISESLNEEFMFFRHKVISSLLVTSLTSN